MRIFQDLTIPTIIFRVALAILVGGLIGFERQRKKGAASLRIYILVCLGAALVMMTNQYIQIKYNIIGDPSRMGAQVVNGIGFLGAGSIIVTGRNQIRGITTAACIWTSACCGLAIGIGFYEGAIMGGLVIFFVASALTSVDKFIRKKSSYLEIYIEYKTEKYSFSDYIEHIREHSFEIINIQTAQELPDGVAESKGRTGYILTLSSMKKRTHEQMIEILLDEVGVRYLQEL